MGVVGRLDQYASMLAGEFDETTANNASITGLGTYYATEFNENIVDIVRDGLVLNLDAGNLASYSGSGTTWTDVSGRGNNGTLTNGPTYSSANGGSLAFNGTNYISSFPTQISTTGSRTVSCFFRTNVTTRNGLCGTRGNAVATGWVLTVNQPLSGSLNYFHTAGSGIDVAAGISINTWYNACVTYDVATATATLYLNGAQIGSPVTSFSAMTPSVFNGAIGAEDGQFNNKFNGNIAQVQVYNRALSATEILQNYNALATRFGLATTNSTAPMLANVFAPYDPVYDEFGGTLFGAGQGRYMRQNTDKSVIVYNEIDEVTDFRDIVRTGLVLDLDAGMNASFNNTGTTWNDLSGNGNNGTLTNGPTYDSSNGGSIVFDGVDDKATTNITSFGNNTTWEAWVNRTTNATAYNMFMGRTLPYFGLRTSNIIFSNIIGGSQQTLNSTGFTPSNNTWYYLAFTTEYDGANTIPKIYINGVLNNSTTFTGAQGGSTSSFTIGEGRSTAVWYPFDGKVSNVKIYNRTLTATEVLQNYNALKHRFGL